MLYIIVELAAYDDFLISLLFCFISKCEKYCNQKLQLSFTELYISRPVLIITLYIIHTATSKADATSATTSATTATTTDGSVVTTTSDGSVVTTTDGSVVTTDGSITTTVEPTPDPDFSTNVIIRTYSSVITKHTRIPLFRPFPVKQILHGHEYNVILLVYYPETTRGVHILGGTLNTEMTDSIACITACLRDDDCMGVDFDNRTNDCYFHSTTECNAFRTKEYCNHYRLTEACG